MKQRGLGEAIHLCAIIVAAILWLGHPTVTSATITQGGTLQGFLTVVPSDQGVHLPGTSYSVSAGSQAVGALSWSHSFSAAIEMGPDGTIGVAETPFLGRSWLDQTGAITFDLSNLDFSQLSGVESIGLQFRSNVYIGSHPFQLTLKDGSTILSTFSGTGSDSFGPFGPWSLTIPIADFAATSRILTVDMSIGGEGQWRPDGIFIMVPEPDSIVLVSLGTLGLLAIAALRVSKHDKVSEIRF